MSEDLGTRIAGSSEVEERILHRVAERAAEWFPDVGATAAVRLQLLAERPRALMYAVHVGSGSGPPRALAKVRRDWPDNVSARPRLTSDFLPASKQTALEFQGLTAIQAMIDPADPRFGAIRPLDQLVDDDTLLMDYVDARTLRDLIVQGSRLSPRRHRAAFASGHEVWTNVGAWLRLFHDHVPSRGLPVRHNGRDDLVQQFAAYDDFLVRALGNRAVGDVAIRGATLAADVLPPELPVAVSHGDFAPRNIFVSDGGRLTVFDPMPRWAVPRFEDLCRFLVGFRLQGLPLYTHGWSDGARELDRREHHVIDGYSRGEALPLAQLRCYQLLITLDKWSALVGTPARGRFRRLRRRRDASLPLVSGHLRNEARRLLDLAERER